jgi:hypothetical protein
MKDALPLQLLSDSELIERLKSFVAREKYANAQVVAHLAELDTRELHLRAGYPSLFAYCVGALGLSRARPATASRRPAPRGGFLSSWTCWPSGRSA